MSAVNGDVVDVQHESTLTAAATPKNFILVVKPTEFSLERRSRVLIFEF